MNAEAVPQILEFGSGALAQCSPASETVPDTTSEVNGQRHDQVSAPRSKAQKEPHHGDDDRGRSSNGQILAAAEWPTEVAYRAGIAPATSTTPKVGRARNASITRPWIPSCITSRSAVRATTSNISVSPIRNDAPPGPCRRTDGKANRGSPRAIRTMATTFQMLASAHPDAQSPTSADDATAA